MRRQILFILGVLLVLSLNSLVSASLFEPETPPSTILNNNSNLSINYITANGGEFYGDINMNNHSIINATYINMTIIDWLVIGNINATGDIYGNDFYYSNGESLEDRYLLLDTSNDPLTNNLTIDITTGDARLWIESGGNKNACLYLMESSTLGFSICNDGAGDNNLVFSAMNGAGDITPVFSFDRDTFEFDLLSDTTITGSLEVTENITTDYYFGSGAYLSELNVTGININCSNCTLGGLSDVDTTGVVNQNILTYHASSGLWRVTSAGVLSGWIIDNTTNWLYNNSDTLFFNNTRLDDEYVTYADFNQQIYGSYDITTRESVIAWSGFCNRTHCYNVSDFLADGDTFWNRNGTDVYLVNINDNVGIGTNSPSHRLVVDSGNVDNYSYLGVRLDNNNRFIKMGNPGTDISQISVDDNDVLAFGQETSFEKNGSEFVELMRIERQGGTEKPRIGIGTNNPQVTLDIVGDINQIDGNTTINMIYGEMSYHNHTATSLNFAVSNVYYNLTFKESFTNGFTFDNADDSLTTQITGVYKLCYFAVGDGINNHKYILAPTINGIVEAKCESHKKMAASGDILTMNGCCLLSLSTDDIIKLAVMDDDDTGTSNYYGANINLVRIGN